MNDHQLIQRQKLKIKSRLDPKVLLGSNLLFVPLEELTEECCKILGDNPFFHFVPPGWQNSAADIDDLDSDSIPAPKNIEEHLSLQIATCPNVDDLLPPYSSAEFWCSVLNEKGYLNTSIDRIARRIGVCSEKALEYIKSLQGYVDPPGLFASDLRECLLIQLERAGHKESLSWSILTDGYEHLAEGRLTDLSRKMCCDKKAIEKALDMLRKLDPSPGSNFLTAPATYPEIEFVMKNGTPVPKLLRENLPSIKSSMGEMSLTLNELLEEKWISPLWTKTKFALIRLGMRYRTLLRISILISEVQSDFLKGEKDTISPLTYVYAARKLELSPSTVCRSINSTWCRAFNSTVRMSTFFSRGLSSRPDVSVKELRSKIFDLNKKGKNDRMIGEIISLPTRTVAWHRKKMGLPRAENS
ncbi:MAG: hypothetical protein VB076_08395 [Synergistaceae bacterium]|nr:hypothetical protein [Synergistaceae bacterium]